jgi:hypothetical protein
MEVKEEGKQKKGSGDKERVKEKEFEEERKGRVQEKVKF